MAAKDITLIVLLIILGIWIWIDYYYEEALNSANTSIVVQIQKDESKTTKNFLTIVTAIGYAYVILPIFILYFEFSDSKSEALAFFSFYSIGNYFVSLLKLVYGRPRPIWYSTEIKAFSCSKAFGNPSGHAFTGGFLLTYISYRFYENYKQRIPYLKEYWTKIYLALSILLAILSILVPYTRLYLGVHSFSQLIYGFYLGVIFHFLYRAYVVDILSMYFKEFMTDNWILKKKVMVMTLIKTCVFVVAVVIGFELIYSDFRINAIWFKNISQKCPDILKDEIKFQIASILDSSTMFITIALFLGAYHQLPDVYKSEENVFLKNYLDLSISKKILRIVVYAGFSAVIYFPLNVIPSTTNVYLLLFFREGLIAFLLSFALVYYSPRFFYYFNLAVEGDYNKYPINKKLVLDRSSEEIKGINYNSSRDNEINGEVQRR